MLMQECITELMLNKGKIIKREDKMPKEKKCLITTSLIGGIEWFGNAPDTVIKEERGGDGKLTWKEKAKQDLLNMLGRVPGDFPIEAQRGVQFEKQVYKYANNMEVLPPNRSDKFIKVCKAVQGYEFYKKGGLTIEIDNEKCYLFGKYDAIKPNEDLKDLKTTKEYRPNKYLNGFQHKLYCFITKIPTFEYVIAEWDEFPKISGVFSEKYIVECFDKLEQEVVEQVKGVFDVIREMELWDLYKEKFCLY